MVPIGMITRIYVLAVLLRIYQWLDDSNNTLPDAQGSNVSDVPEQSAHSIQYPTEDEVWDCLEANPPPMIQHIAYVEALANTDEESDRLHDLGVLVLVKTAQAMLADPKE